MTENDKVKYLRLALNLQGLHVDKKATDLIITTYNKVLELGGKFNLDDAVDIQDEMYNKYAESKSAEGDNEKA